MGCGGAGSAHPGAHRLPQDVPSPGGAPARQNPELGDTTPRSYRSSSAGSPQGGQGRTPFELGRIPGVGTVGARQRRSRRSPRALGRPGARLHAGACRFFRPLPVRSRYHPRADGGRSIAFYESPAHPTGKGASRQAPGGSRGQMAFGPPGTCRHAATAQPVGLGCSLPGPQGSTACHPRSRRSLRPD